jgi:hypothetical protein
MSEDQTQRKMDFIIEQQAKSEQRISRLERVMKLAIRAGLRERRDTRHNINALINAQLHTDEAMAKLAEAQAHTDERLSALIDVVNEGRSGQ